ncbi:MAG: Ldh family oxidoreductase [Pseudomonadota bacterium]
MSDTTRIPITEAETLLEQVFSANGVLPASATSVACALVAAEAEGQVGHGFSRVNDYVAQLRSGKVDGAAVAQLNVDGPGAATIDARDGFAYPALDTGIDWGIDAARMQGTAAFAIHRSHHCGALSVQVDRIARAGLVAMMVANSPAAIAPWGSKTPVFGTNPIAFAAPRADGPPLVIDLSLSRVARGKVMHAKKSGKPIPEGWALDRDGAPTTDPDAALEGTMVPIGEAKGTALALMVEVLAASFAGANTSPHVNSFFTAEGPPCGAGQFVLILRPADPDAFTARMESLLALIEHQDGARLPGSRRIAALNASRENGVLVSSHYLETAKRLSDAADA